MRYQWLALLGSTALIAAPAVALSVDKPQLGAFGFDSAGMDRSVQPGDSFYDFANGGWQAKTEIPADRSTYGMFNTLQDLSRERTRTILDEAAAKPGSKIGDFYASFMDQAAADSKGLAPLKPLLADIKATDSRTALAAELGKLGRLNIAGPFDFGVGQDDRAPDTYIVEMRQSGLGLPDRDYYLRDDASIVKARAAYQTYLAQLLTLAGEADAAPRAQAVIAFETEMAKVQWPRSKSRDIDLSYNKWSRADFDAKAPGFDWTAYFGAVGVNSRPAYLVHQPDAFTNQAALFAKTPLPVLKDYALLHTLDVFAPYLSSPFVDARFAFRGTALSGQPKNLDRWKRGIDLVSGQMGEEVGQIYVARYFPPEAKAAADQLVKNIIAAMHDRLLQLEWMAPETKQKALVKLASFTPKIGYPTKWRDYSALVVKRDDLLGNVMRGFEFENNRQLHKLDQPIDRTEWQMTPMTINAYANPVMNEIVFPAAILQPPFFDPKADAAVNYGAIGVVIGHELSHHFDDQGRKYDANGKLTDWWTAEDVKRFAALTEKLVAQYDAYEPLPGFHIKGDNTQGENIADLAGLAIAYDAYHKSLGGKPAPVLGGFSGDQRFYLGYAQVWRTKYREEALRQQIVSNEHSPGEQRVDEVRNVDAWYQAFGAKPGSTLYLSPDQRVRIW